MISGHLPNADSHLLVVSTCYNGQCKQMPRFRWSVQPKIACAQLRAPKLASVSSLKFPCCRLVTNEQYQRDATSSRVMNHVIAANQPLHWLRLLYDITSEKSRILFVPVTSGHLQCTDTFAWSRGCPFMTGTTVVCKLWIFHVIFSRKVIKKRVLATALFISCFYRLPCRMCSGK